jgi:hypothetical protein
MACIRMDNDHTSHARRYVASVLLILIVASLLFPMFEGLSATGFFGDKTYLIILQDNQEIRSTGGLMACMGVLTTHDGSIASLKYYYLSSPQLSAIVGIDGPTSFTNFFGVNAAALSDSNVQYDFASFAPKMQSDFYNVTGQKVDGIIAVDFTALQAFMNVTGPITVSGEVLTSRNVVDRLHFDVGTAQGDKTSFTDLLSTLTSDLARSILDASIPQKLALYTTLQSLEAEKHVLVYPDEGFLFQGAGGELQKPTTDSISVVDTTVGTAMADFSVNRTIDYHVELLANGSAVSTLTLTYTNNNWWDYDVFSTTLVPPGAELVAAHNVSSAFKGPELTSGDGFTAFSSRILVAANSTGSMTYVYTLPNIVTGSGIGSNYDLLVQKQAGIVQYALNVSVQLPAGATMIHAENVGSNQVVTGDAQVSVIYT